MSFTEFLNILPQKMFPKDLLQGVQLFLAALDYLNKCHVVHTGILCETKKKKKVTCK